MNRSVRVRRDELTMSAGGRWRDWLIGCAGKGEVRSHGALHGFSQRGLPVYFALFALLALALTGLLVRGGSPSVSSEVPALSLPASAPRTQTATSNVPEK